MRDRCGDRVRCDWRKYRRCASKPTSRRFCPPSCGFWSRPNSSPVRGRSVAAPASTLTAFSSFAITATHTIATGAMALHKTIQVLVQKRRIRDSCSGHVGREHIPATRITSGINTRSICDWDATSQRANNVQNRVELKAEESNLHTTKQKPITLLDNV